MNTLGWSMKDPDGRRHIWALHGSIALYTKFDTDEVWMYTPRAGRDEAMRELHHQTANAEVEGARLVGEPMEFNLTAAAVASIQIHDEGRWVDAALLNRELILGVRPVRAGAGIRWEDPIIAASPTLPASAPIGDLHFESDDRKLKVWTGTAWVELGTVRASGVTMTPEGATLFD